jgi:hypothetical protein
MLAEYYGRPFMQILGRYIKIAVVNNILDLLEFSKKKNKSVRLNVKINNFNTRSVKG